MARMLYLSLFPLFQAHVNEIGVALLRFSLGVATGSCFYPSDCVHTHHWGCNVGNGLCRYPDFLLLSEVQLTESVLGSVFQYSVDIQLQ